MSDRRTQKAHEEATRLTKAEAIRAPIAKGSRKPTLDEMDGERD